MAIDIPRIAHSGIRTVDGLIVAAKTMDTSQRTSWRQTPSQKTCGLQIAVSPQAHVLGSQVVPAGCMTDRVTYRQYQSACENRTLGWRQHSPPVAGCTERTANRIHRKLSWGLLTLILVLDSTKAGCLSPSKSIARRPAFQASRRDTASGRREHHTGHFVSQTTPLPYRPRHRSSESKLRYR